MNALPKDFPIRGIEVIGGFQMVALYHEGKFEHAACSCGWKWQGEENQMLEACTLHNMTHANVVKIKSLYEARNIGYDGALNFLQIVCDIDEGRASDLVASWQIRSEAPAA